MALEFGLAELLQRTKDERLKPMVVFDITHWAKGRECVSTSTDLVGVNAIGTNLAAFTVPKDGLYQVLASISTGVLAAFRTVRLALDTEPPRVTMWDHRLKLTQARNITVGPITLFMSKSQTLFWVLETAMIAGDDMTGALTIWELVG